MLSELLFDLNILIRYYLISLILGLDMTDTAAVAISVIIPIYNVEKYLQRCLNSVVNQTFDNIEIICINDGSTDKSGEILSKFALNDPRFRVITQENQGLSASRNNGLEVASGAYIFFLDADDYLHPQTLEIFYNTAQKSECPIVISTSFCRLGKDLLKTKKYRTSEISYKIYTNPLEDLFKHRLVSAVVWNKLYRSTALKHFRFIEGIYYEDWPFSTCVFANISRFSAINEKLYLYNTTSPSIVRSSFSIKKIQDYICGIRHIYNYFKACNNPTQWNIVRKKRISRSLKMILSKITKSTENKNELEQYFLQEYLKLKNDGIITFRDLTLKSKIRFLRILWHQRQKQLNASNKTNHTS